jgi:tetratricopeptide (TPR) repeat protein
MLETIRQYGLEKLAEAGEVERRQDRHLAWFLGLAENAELFGPGQNEWLARLEAEHENLGVALEWSLRERQGSDNDGDANAALRFAGALHRFWEIRGYFREGLEWCRHALARSGDDPSPERARVLNNAGVLATRHGDYGAARKFHEDCLAARRALGDWEGEAGSLHNLGLIVYYQGDHSAAESLYEQALAVNRQLGNRAWEANNLNNLGVLAKDRGDLAQARSLFRESLSIRRETGDNYLIARSLLNLGDMARMEGDYASAGTLFEESLDTAQQLGDRASAAGALQSLGIVAKHVGDFRSARRLLGDALAISAEIGDQLEIAETLDELAHLETESGEPRRAARLYGAVDTLRRVLGAPRTPDQQRALEDGLKSATAVLGKPVFEAEWEAGRALSADQAIEYALNETPMYVNA